MDRLINLKDKERIIELVTVLNDSSNKYYNGLEPTLTDEQYDNMLNELNVLETSTDFILSNSPNRRVGYKVLDDIGKKKLPHKMLSLDKLKNDTKALIKWIDNKKSVMLLKMDGLSCMLDYKDGVLVGCYTRGNGTEGSDVTEMVKSLKSVPNIISAKGGVQIVGEIIIRKDMFDKINDSREEKFANARNLASGTLMSLNTSLGRERGLEFIAFGIHDDKNEDYIRNLQRIEGLGINTADCIPLYEDITEKELDKYIQSMKELAEDRGYPIDGLVITYNDANIRAKCKPTDKYPTHSIAYKFQDEYEETIIRGIELSISRNNVLTPVAIFDKVVLDGTEVSRANIHNMSIVKAMKIGIGDSVKVIKANQIIPQILGNNTKSGNWNIPGECPFCGGKTKLIGDSSLELICTNVSCTEAEILRINHFLSKDALNAKGVSEKIIKKLMRLNEVSNIYDVLNLPSRREYLIKKNYPTLGRKTINNMCDAIEAACNTTLDRFLISLGIEGLGRKVSKDIANRYETIENIMNNMTIPGLKSIDGIDATAKSLFNDLTNQFEHIRKLLEYITIEESRKDIVVNNKLNGKTFVFTGKTKEFKNRKEVEEFINGLGAKMSGSVTSKTDYLICNSVETSSKYKKAIELGIQIITDEELKNMGK
ncbi:MAG: NAD-dependent DNA ligase LigA [Sarcina sp.]